MSHGKLADAALARVGCVQAIVAIDGLVEKQRDLVGDGMAYYGAVFGIPCNIDVAGRKEQGQ
jgi:hypothetical protein